MIYSHARCDNCEAILVPEGDREFVDEDYIREKGWLTISWRDRDETKNSDFCTYRCVNVWAGVRDESKK